jgi:hypothetical protein
MHDHKVGGSSMVSPHTAKDQKPSHLQHHTMAESVGHTLLFNVFWSSDRLARSALFRMGNVEGSAGMSILEFRLWLLLFDVGCGTADGTPGVSLRTSKGDGTSWDLSTCTPVPHDTHWMPAMDHKDLTKAWCFNNHKLDIQRYLQQLFHGLYQDCWCKTQNVPEKFRSAWGRRNRGQGLIGSCSMPPTWCRL